MGTVWLGHDEMLARDVAVKFLSHLSSANDPGFKRFLDGARAAAAIRHECITAVLTADLHEGVPYLIMEFVDGPTLADLLARFGPLPATAVCAAVAQICRAVAELHRLELVHRDIKPRNVLIDGEARCRVTDFGLACQRPGAGQAGTAGTPAYLAPEAFAGTISARSDVYAIGVTAFELLTGDVPWSGSPEEIRRRVLTEELRLDALADRAVPEAMGGVIRRAMHREARLRYRSADALLHALEMECAAPLAAGSQELAMLVRRCRAAPRDPSTGAANGPRGYYARIAARADEARDERRRDEPGVSTAAAPPASEGARHALPCIACGYDLRGVRHAPNCPECGRPRAHSLAPDRLIFADPRWFDRVRRGLTLAYASVAIPIVLLIVLPVGWAAYTLATFSSARAQASAVVAAPATMPASASAPVVTRVSTLNAAMQASAILTVALIVLWGIGLVAGMFLATSREPGVHERGVSARRVTRVAMAVAVAAPLCTWFATQRESGELRDAAANLAQAALLVACAGLVVWLRELARRAGRPRQRSQALWTLVSIALLASLWVATRAAWLAGGIPSTPRELRSSRNWTALTYYGASATAPGLALVVAVSMGWRQRQMLKSLRPQLVSREALESDGEAIDRRGD